MSASARCAPREARRCAVARPMPDAAPVTVITFPEREDGVDMAGQDEVVYLAEVARGGDLGLLETLVVITWNWERVLVEEDLLSIGEKIERNFFLMDMQKGWGMYGVCVCVLRGEGEGREKADPSIVCTLSNLWNTPRHSSNLYELRVDRPHTQLVR